LFNPNINIPRGWDISLTPTANSGTNYCTTVTSNNFVVINGVSINSGTIQSAQITGLNVAQLAICTIPGVLYLSQNGGGSWATVTPALQPVCDGLYQLPSDVPAGYAWTLGGIQNNGFNATLQGHIAEVIIWNRVLNSTEVLALQTYLATAK
jgi:hypothetical protein